MEKFEYPKISAKRQSQQNVLFAMILQEVELAHVLAGLCSDTHLFIRRERFMKIVSMQPF